MHYRKYFFIITTLTALLVSCKKEIEPIFSSNEVQAPNNPKYSTLEIIYMNNEKKSFRVKQFNKLSIYYPYEYEIICEDSMSLKIKCGPALNKGMYLTPMSGNNPPQNTFYCTVEFNDGYKKAVYEAYNSPSGSVSTNASLVNDKYLILNFKNLYLRKPGISGIVAGITGSAPLLF